MPKNKNEALKNIRVNRVGEHEWAFEYPRLTMEAMDGLDEAIEHYRSGDYASAKIQFNGLVNKFPEFIDAYHHLALTLDAMVLALFQLDRLQERKRRWRKLYGFCRLWPRR